MLKKQRKLVSIIIVLISIISFFVLKGKLIKEKYQDIDNDIVITNDNLDKVEPENCMIDVKGAVLNPGVYTTSCEDNVSDVIRLAGGLTDDADTSVTNLAKKVTNEMVIIIYTKEEVKNSNVVDTVVKVVEQECICPNIQNDGCINDEITDTIGGNKLININTANQSELEKIPGIGEVKAEAIVTYRQKNGLFKDISEIQNVEGIGSKLYEAIKVYITT